MPLEQNVRRQRLARLRHFPKLPRKRSPIRNPRLNLGQTAKLSSLSTMGRLAKDKQSNQGQSPYSLLKRARNSGDWSRYLASRSYASASDLYRKIQSRLICQMATSSLVSLAARASMHELRDHPARLGEKILTSPQHRGGGHFVSPDLCRAASNGVDCFAPLGRRRLRSIALAEIVVFPIRPTERGTRRQGRIHGVCG